MSGRQSPLWFKSKSHREGSGCVTPHSLYKSLMAAHFRSQTEINTTASADGRSQHHQVLETAKAPPRIRRRMRSVIPQPPKHPPFGWAKESQHTVSPRWSLDENLPRKGEGKRTLGKAGGWSPSISYPSRTKAWDRTPDSRRWSLMCMDPQHIRGRVH